MIDEIILGIINNEDIEEDNTQLVKISLFNEMIYMDMPVMFTEMSIERIKERYTVEPRPQIIYADESGKINFALNMLELKISDLQTYAYKIRESIRMVHPNTLFYDEDFITDQDNKSIQCFDFRSSSLEGPTYNVMYLIQVPEKTLLGNFNCPFEVYTKWRPIVKRVIKSITKGEIYESI